MKNSTKNKTASFKRMRQQELDHIKAKPFYGLPLAEQMYNTLKKHYNILQVGICGQIVSVVHYKKDEATMLHILAKMFPERRVKQQTSELTELVTTFTLPAV